MTSASDRVATGQAAPDRVATGQAAPDRFLDTSGTGSWIPGPPHQSGLFRASSATPMYDPGRVVLIGGWPGTNFPTASVEVIDLNDPAPAWRIVAPMEYGRTHHNAPILADGTILVTGGTSGAGFNDFAGAVYAPELWDPESETWSTMAGMQVRRIYHSFSLLLPDGRVLTAGGDIRGADLRVPGMRTTSMPRSTRRPTCSRGRGR